MDYRERAAEDQRLVILRSLSEDAAAYTLNESMLQGELETWGHRIGREKVRTHLAWLEDQGYVTTNDVMGCMVATLTSRGLDVAQGNVTVPGVKRPRPR